MDFDPSAMVDIIDGSTYHLADIDLLLTNQTLTHLKLHRNNISDGGMAALSVALNKNS